MINADQIKALAAAPDGKIHEKLLQKKPVGDNEVGIRVTHSGVCATDLHYVHADMVLGHEGLEST
jgi:D-arabinose 1-dehydrogenase-like Zn-dependent alcohol dehydrogenase